MQLAISLYTATPIISASAKFTMVYRFGTELSGRTGRKTAVVLVVVVTVWCQYLSFEKKDGYRINFIHLVVVTQILYCCVHMYWHVVFASCRNAAPVCPSQVIRLEFSWSQYFYYILIVVIAVTIVMSTWYWYWRSMICWFPREWVFQHQSVDWKFIPWWEEEPKLLTVTRGFWLHLLIRCSRERFACSQCE